MMFDPKRNAIISEEKKFIYIKIGKVATSSIHHYLLEKEVPNLISSFDNYDIYDRWAKRFDRKDYYVFTFVRNPWDRMVSIWNYHRAYLPEFKEFIRSNFRYKSHSGKEKVSIHNHCRQMIEYIFTEPDFIGKYENLYEDWKVIADKIGVSNILPYSNKTQGKKDVHYSAYYDKSDVEVVRKLYKDDIERFNYEFEMVRKESRL
jgi:hypothetical protein